VYACCVSQGIIKHYLRKIDDFDGVLFQIYWSICMPKVIKIELGLTKLLQNKMVKFF